MSSIRGFAVASAGAARASDGAAPSSRASADGAAASSKPPTFDPRAGLCPRCLHVRVIRSSRGSTFYLCELATSDPRFTKYPPQPVLSCVGFEPSP